MHALVRFATTAALITTGAALIAGCGGGDKLKASFATCVWGGGVLVDDADEALADARSRLLATGGGLAVGDFSTLDDIREMEETSASYKKEYQEWVDTVEETKGAKGKLRKLVWEDGEGGGSILMGDTDQYALVLIAEESQRDNVADAARDFFKSDFHKSNGGDSFEEFSAKNVLNYGSNAVVVDLNGARFSKRSKRSLDACAEKSKA